MDIAQKVHARTEEQTEVLEELNALRLTVKLVGETLSGMLQLTDPNGPLFMHERRALKAMSMWNTFFERMNSERQKLR